MTHLAFTSLPSSPSLCLPHRHFYIYPCSKRMELTHETVMADFNFLLILYSSFCVFLFLCSTPSCLILLCLTLIWSVIMQHHLQVSREVTSSSQTPDIHVHRLQKRAVCHRGKFDWFQQDRSTDALCVHCISRTTACVVEHYCVCYYTHNKPVQNE